jgi:dihydroneopterin aldolase
MSDDTASESDTTDTTKPSAAERACFETGIKFGSLYHQFAGTPVSPESATSLARAIEESIGNQPHCESVTVEILEDELAAAIDHGYTELTGRFIEVEIVVECDGQRVTAGMAMEDGYPLMAIESVEEAE